MNGFLLDTNIPSELFRASPASTVLAWFEQQTRSSLHVSVVTLGELRRGVALLPAGSGKRSELEAVTARRVPELFDDRVLPVTRAIAEIWGLIGAQRQSIGKPLPVADGLIAATAIEHGLTLVTRNTKDFIGLDLAVLNPWQTN